MNLSGNSTGLYTMFISYRDKRADAMAAMVQASGVEGLKILTGSELDENCINVRMTSVIVNICNDSLAARVKRYCFAFIRQT